jgi:hypothetical protein
MRMRCCGSEFYLMLEEPESLYLEEIIRGEVERCRGVESIDQWVEWRKRPRRGANQGFSDSLGVWGLTPQSNNWPCLGWTGMY